MAFSSEARVGAARCWLCPRGGNGRESNSRFRFSHIQMVDAGTASLCACVCVELVLVFVRLYSCRGIGTH